MLPGRSVNRFMKCSSVLQYGLWLILAGNSHWEIPNWRTSLKATASRQSFSEAETWAETACRLFLDPVQHSLFPQVMSVISGGLLPWESVTLHEKAAASEQATLHAWEHLTYISTVVTNIIYTFSHVVKKKPVMIMTAIESSNSFVKLMLLVYIECNLCYI